MSDISAKFSSGHFQRGSQIQIGYVKIGDFRPIFRYISEMVQPRTQLLVCTIANDIERPLTTKNHPIFYSLYRLLYLHSGCSNTTEVWWDLYC